MTRPSRGWCANRRARLDRTLIYYEPGCGFCLKTARAFRKLCLTPGAVVLPADQDAKALALLKQNNSWLVYDPEGRVWMHWRAVAYVLKQNPLTWIAGFITDLPPLRPVMRKFYDWIGARRPLWSRWLR